MVGIAVATMVLSIWVMKTEASAAMKMSTRRSATMASPVARAAWLTASLVISAGTAPLIAHAGGFAYAPFCIGGFLVWCAAAMRAQARAGRTHGIRHCPRHPCRELAARQTRRGARFHSRVVLRHAAPQCRSLR